MTSTRTAIVLGGSGSVGTALLRELLHDDGFNAVITLTRRSQPEAVAMARAAGRTLVEKLVPDMTPAAVAAATIEAATIPPARSAVVSVFRPAMIIGSQIAKAMIATAKHHPAASATYHYPDMMGLIASGQR